MESLRQVANVLIIKKEVDASGKTSRALGRGSAATTTDLPLPQRMRRGETKCFASDEGSMAPIAPDTQSMLIEGKVSDLEMIQ